MKYETILSKRLNFPKKIPTKILAKMQTKIRTKVALITPPVALEVKTLVALVWLSVAFP